MPEHVTTHVAACWRANKSARRRPDWIWPTAASGVWKVTSVSPLIVEAMAGPPPLYGTCTRFAPLMYLNSSAPRWVSVPAPEDE